MFAGTREQRIFEMVFHSWWKEVAFQAERSLICFRLLSAFTLPVSVQYFSVASAATLQALQLSFCECNVCVCVCACAYVCVGMCVLSKQFYQHPLFFLVLELTLTSSPLELFHSVLSCICSVVHVLKTQYKNANARTG